MVKKSTAKPAATRASLEKKAAPPTRLRVRLNTIDDVKKEMARLYREARAKKVDSQDASRMANMLSILGRLIEGSEIQQQIDEIKQALDKERPQKGKAWATRH